MVSQQNGGYNWNIQVEEVLEQANLVNIVAEGSDSETGEDGAYIAEMNDQLSEVSSELHCEQCDNLSKQLKKLTDQYVSLDSQYRTLKEDHHYTKTRENSYSVKIKASEKDRDMKLLPRGSLLVHCVSSLIYRVVYE